jgi:hypothetical protein
LSLIKYKECEVCKYHSLKLIEKEDSPIWEWRCKVCDNFIYFVDEDNLGDPGDDHESFNATCPNCEINGEIFPILNETRKFYCRECSEISEGDYYPCDYCGDYYIGDFNPDSYIEGCGGCEGRGWS